MYASTTYLFTLLLTFVYGREISDVNDRISAMLPEDLKKGTTCLINSNQVFDFPLLRLSYTNEQSVWFNKDAVSFSPNLYIIELFPNDSLEHVIIELHRNSLFNPRAVYILITDAVTEVTSCFKKFYITNALMVKRNGTMYQYGNKLQVVTFFPSFQTATGPNIENVALNVGFIRKAPYVICLNCSTNKGLELELLDLVSNHLKLHIEYFEFHSTYWGAKVNGAYNYLLKELFDRKVDVVFGQVIDFEHSHLDFDPTLVHIIDSTRFVVPKVKINRSFDILSNLLQTKVVTTYKVVVAIVFLTVCVIKRWKDMSGQFLEFILIMYDGAFNTRRIKSVAMRVLYAFFIFSVIIYNTGIKSKLFRSFTMDHFDYQINTLEDILKYNLRPVFNRYIGGYFSGGNPVDVYMNTKSLRTCGVDLGCVDLVAFQRNATTIKLKNSLEYYIPRKYMDEEGRPLIHIINEDIQLYYMRFYFVKGHPVFERFNQVVTSLIESGIMNHLLKVLKEGNKKVQVKAEMKYQQISVHKLKLVQFALTFRLYMYGIVLSSMVFCMEFAWFYLMQKR